MTGRNETWRPVIGRAGSYEVSSNGRVRSLTRRVPYQGRYQVFYRTCQGKLLTPNLINSGYLVVHLYEDGKRTVGLVHRLVAEAFHGPAPAGMEVNHKDFDTLNNHSANLHWCTPKENNQHSAAHRPAQGNAVVATSATGEKRAFRSQARAEMALLGQMTGIVSWALKTGRPAIGYSWSRA